MRSLPLLLRRCRRFLAGPPGPSDENPLAGQARRFVVAQGIVRGFYAFLLYLAVSQLSSQTGSDLLVRHADAPLWPVAWLRWMPGAVGVRGLLAFYGVTNVAGAFFARFRAARLAVFLGILEFVALKNSFGKIGHSQHLLVIVAGALVLLPVGWTLPGPLVPRRRRQETLLTVWLAQAAILLAYTMSGLGKLGGAVYQLAAGQRNVFQPGAFGAHIAQRLVQTGSRSTLGDWIVHHPYLTWPLMPTAVVFETLAFLAAFRPALARPVAVLLILFHVGTYYTMTISFPANCLLLALFFLASPFEPITQSWQNFAFALPCARKAWTFWQSSRKTSCDER